MVELLKVTEHRPVKLGYFVGVLIALIVLVFIPLNWLINGTTDYLILTMLWGAGRTCQALYVTAFMLKNGAKWKEILKEVVAYSLYWWRPT